VTRPYVLTHGAAGDLNEIVRYTSKNWGQAQCRAYVSRIESAATELAYGQGVFRNRGDLVPGLRVRRVEHHYVFCLPRIDQPALILAILHERMDMIARLKSRLD